jgi:hypothetical protein
MVQPNKQRNATYIQLGSSNFTQATVMLFTVTQFDPTVNLLTVHIILTRLRCVRVKHALHK